ncbi:hypothetical protein [Streptomyces sp. NBC_01373]|uniref:hypothetical protein n=1 Tax=Streptomyces sp. NBC_01373 TaxID=2903843 RepID=UPI00225ACA7A|nr:hypothetical protein [Streptomyces sp. NBC_01373]MCX4697028.1 hypothetical protein [Streptomyces sp. NBC_01373]MCX4707047.1 hypothetical protein [Streptomyces sp. NBC_01373]
MTDKPATRRQGPQPRYVNRRSLALLGFSFRGKVPAAVIAEALLEKAVRERRPLPPAEGDAS